MNQIDFLFIYNRVTNQYYNLYVNASKYDSKTPEYHSNIAHIFRAKAFIFARNARATVIIQDTPALNCKRIR